MSDLIYLNGEIVPAAEARISAFDAGLNHAAGLFETMRSYGGRVMRLNEHVKRMSNSADALEMLIRVDPDEIADGIRRLLAANSLQDARIRMVATPGEVPRPGRLEVKPGSQTLIISASQVQPYPPLLYAQGMRVCISDYRQNRQDPIAGHKTLAYMPRLIALKEAADRECHEALWFTTDNLLAEGCVCNVFVVHDGVISTPPLDTPILPGATRNAIIELSRENGMSMHERPIDIDVLLAADEVFLTGSVLEVMPVTFIEKHRVGEGVPGARTREIQGLYKRLVAKECEIG
ncbi:MAG: aminotransferase class IV family protein [Phycisphaerae bacterium]|nr:aminotransferase class IV family protein [Phycisphaerae bacterium]